MYGRGKGRGKGSAGAPDASVAKGGSESCTRLTPTSHHTHARARAKPKLLSSFLSSLPPSGRVETTAGGHGTVISLFPLFPLRLYKFPPFAPSPIFLCLLFGLNGNQPPLLFFLPFPSAVEAAFFSSSFWFSSEHEMRFI